MNCLVTLDILGRIFTNSSWKRALNVTFFITFYCMEYSDRITHYILDLFVSLSSLSSFLHFLSAQKIVRPVSYCTS